MSEGDSHESDILFCPFCGDVDALEVQHLEGAILYPAYRVACDNCGAAFAIRSDIDEWNTRAIPAVQPDPREAALRDIARQKKTDEMDTEYDVEYADFEGGYDAIIDVARVALRAVQPVTVDQLAQIIRIVDGTHSLGAGELAERILSAVALPAVQPDAHVNETPKSEHVPGDVLTPATKGGDA